MSTGSTSEINLALAGIGACGTGFNSAAHLAQQLTIPFTQEVPACAPADSTLDSWAIAATGAAMQAAQKRQSIDTERIGLLYVSQWGSINQTVAYLESMLADNGLYASPRLFTRSVYSAVASQTTIELGIHGGCETLAFVNLPVCRMLQRAWCLLATGRLDAVIALWADLVEEPAMHLCQRAAAELQHPELARFTQPGGGSVALALVRPTVSNPELQLTLQKHIHSNKAMRKASVPEPVLPSIPAYPTDGALRLARELMWCHARCDRRVWQEIDPPFQAAIRLQAAQNGQ
jgi:hypothetical protein